MTSKLERVARLGQLDSGDVEVALELHAGHPEMVFHPSRANAEEFVCGLLRGRNPHSLRDPAWWPTGGHNANTGVATTGDLRCVGSTRLCALVVLVAHVLGDRARPELLALAGRLLVEGRAQPVQGVAELRRGVPE